MKIYAAPLQGFTDVAWRHFHAEVYGGIASYYTPFLRIEKGILRPQDVKGISSPLNSNQILVPQILFKDINEFDILVTQIFQQGYRTIDLNLGCPFPPQVKRGRGAAVICNHELLKDIAHRISNTYSDITFSIKMRLGTDSPDQWNEVIDIINDMSLSHITIHPRIAIQQYSGDLYLDQFSQLIARSKNSVIFNGDIKNSANINDIIIKFPTLFGIMIGRGLLMRPSLASEYVSGKEWDSNHRIQALLEFHGKMLDYYQHNLCGETQILSKIKPFWEYLEPEIGHKTVKFIRKSTSLTKYLSAIAQIR